MLKPFALAALLAAVPSFSALAPLTTLAEETGFKRTGRYEEVEKLCKAYEERWAAAVRCVEFGRSPEGRPMLALVATRAKNALSAAQAKAAGLPVLLMQGGIHAGEIDGKDAGFVALRELLENRVARGALERVVLIFVPVFNVDGHERFGRWNRPNQVGPEEMGWRVTSQNLNLNRDYTKAEAPEMQAMLRLLNEWDPILYVDLHVTDGAQFQHDIANVVEPVFAGDPALHPTGKAIREETNRRLAKEGSKPLPFYPSFRERGKPESGFAFEAYPPRYSTGYWALRNRFAMLVETHSWKDYPTRVRTTRNVIVALTDMAAHNGRTWLEAAQAADTRARGLGGTMVALDYENTERHHMMDFAGYAWERVPSDVSGGTALRYYPQKPQLWQIPIYDEVRPAIEITAPQGGYIVPPAHAAWMAEKLKLHNVEYRVVDADTRVAETQVEVFRADSVEFGEKPLEGRMTAKLTGKWRVESQSILPGSLFVPVAQAHARLLLTLLEPHSPDSFAAWGFFNAHFEAKEYMEDYVAEDVGREMLATRPEVAAEFRKRLETDAGFAQSPKARLEFFYRLHPSWDQRLNLYPVIRVGSNPFH